MSSNSPSVRVDYRQIWRHSNSTKWPGFTRLAIFVLVAIAVFACIDLGLGVFMFKTVSRVPEVMDFCEEGPKARPVTFWTVVDGEKDLSNPISLGQVGKLNKIWSFLVNPILLVFPTLILLLLHILSRASNRLALIFSAIICVYMTLFEFSIVLVRVPPPIIQLDPLTPYEDDWPQCTVADKGVYAKLERERGSRGEVSWEMIGVEAGAMLFACTYLCLAWIAARHNAHEAIWSCRRAQALESAPLGAGQDVEMQDLSPAVREGEGQREQDPEDGIGGGKGTGRV